MLFKNNSFIRTNFNVLDVKKNDTYIRITSGGS